MMSVNGAMAPHAARMAVQISAAVATVALLAVGLGRRGAPAAATASAKADCNCGSGPGSVSVRPGSPPGWKAVLLRVYGKVSEHRVLAIAAGVSFYAILAIFPALAALVSLYGLFADPATITARADQLSGILPGGAIEVVGDQLTRVAAQPHGTLGFTFAIGLATALWSANAGIKALFDALNVVYDEHEKRGLVALNAVSLAFTTGIIVFLLLATVGVVILPPALAAIGLGGAVDIAVRTLRWPLLFVLVAILLALVYRFGPSRDQPRWRWISRGSAIAALLWLVASGLFSWYAANFGSFNATYGSLGAVIGFMTWMWISAIVVLLGAELDAELERLANGKPPLGARCRRSENRRVS
jgi:membrane protein